MKAKKAEYENGKKISIIDKIAVVSLTLKRWSGTTQIDESVNYSLRNKQSLNIYPPTGLKFYYEVRNNVFRRWLHIIGLEFMGQWIIPAYDVEKTNAFFHDQKEYYQNQIDIVEQKYDEFFKEAYEKNPKFQTILNRPRFKKENILKNFQFTWYFFKMVPVEGKLTKDEFLKKANTLQEALYIDVAEKAEEWCEKKSDLEILTSRIAGPIRKIEDKLEGFRFLGPTVLATISLIKASLLNLPVMANNLPLNPILTEQVKVILWILEDAERCQYYSNLVVEGQTTNQVFEQATRDRFFAKKNLISLSNSF